MGAGPLGAPERRPRDADPGEPRLLRLVEPGLRAVAPPQHGRRFRLRLVDRAQPAGCERLPGPASALPARRRARSGPAARRRGFGDREPRRPRVLQVRELRARQLERRRRDARRGGARGRRVPAGRAPARNQLLHLPIDELHDRRVPRARARDHALRRLRLLCVALHAARRRPDPALLGGCRSARRPAPGPEPLRTRRRALLARDGEEGAARKPGREGRGPLLRGAVAVGAGCLVGGARVRVPDLLRLLRLLGHGDRPRAALRLRVPEELRRSVPKPFVDRVLAALAHLALRIPARLPVPAARRQPSRHHAHLREPDDRDAARRPLARRCGDLRRLGRHPRRGPRGRARARRAHRETDPGATARRVDLRPRRRRVGVLPRIRPRERAALRRLDVRRR